MDEPIDAPATTVVSAAWTRIEERLQAAACARLERDDYVAFDLSEASDVGRLQAVGLDLAGETIGAGNVVLVHRSIERRVVPLALIFAGGGNVVVLGEGTQVTGICHLTGADNVVVFMGGGHVQRIASTLYDGNTLIWGRNSTAYGVRVWVHGGKSCVVGEDCLFSDNINIRTTDHHAIVDLKTRTQTNEPASVIIGRHVWVGEDCAIAKGVTIGTGSIVGGRSFVNKSIPATELWAGSPARMIRQDVSWVDSSPCSPEEVEALIASLAVPD